MRIVLWGVSLLVSVLLFSAFLSHGWPNQLFIQATLTFALPAWLLYLPLVVTYYGTNPRQYWILLITGVLIGPLSMAAWGAILLLRGESAHAVWAGDPEAGGMASNMLWSMIVGSLTTIFYVTALKLVRSSFRPREF